MQYAIAIFLYIYTIFFFFQFKITKEQGGHFDEIQRSEIDVINKICNIYVIIIFMMSKCIQSLHDAIQ